MTNYQVTWWHIYFRYAPHQMMFIKKHTDMHTKITSVMFLITCWIIRKGNGIHTTITLLIFCHSSKCSEKKRTKSLKDTDSACCVAFCNAVIHYNCLIYIVLTLYYLRICVLQSFRHLVKLQTFQRWNRRHQTLISTRQWLFGALILTENQLKSDNVWGFIFYLLFVYLFAHTSATNERTPVVSVVRGASICSFTDFDKPFLSSNSSYRTLAWAYL